MKLSAPIDTLRHHFILCRYGRMASIVAQQFKQFNLEPTALIRPCDRVVAVARADSRRRLEIEGNA